MSSRRSCILGFLAAITAFAISCGGGKADSSSGDTTSSGSTSAGGSGGAASSSGAGGSSGQGGAGGIGTSSAATTGSSATTGGGSKGVSDEFEGASLDSSWSIVNGSNFSYAVSGGALQITPTTNTLWWKADASGALVYKLVTGNFKITTAVKARRASNPSLPVGPTDFQFGGIMARAPGSSGESYVFAVVGDRGATLQVETKSTVNDESQVQAEDWPSGDAQLRLCRVGSVFHVLSRPYSGGSWAIASPFGPPYERPDLPATLQVGPIAYTWTDSPDLRAAFEYARFEQVDDESDCTAN